MPSFKIPDDPIFHDVARKHTRITVPLIGCIGTAIGIHSAFKELNTGNPLDLLGPGILEVALLGLVGGVVSVVLIYAHYWLTKR
jgi:biopolymer transport protein ExbB/TolQ